MDLPLKPNILDDIAKDVCPLIMPTKCAQTGVRKI